MAKLIKKNVSMKLKTPIYYSSFINNNSFLNEFLYDNYIRI